VFTFSAKLGDQSTEHVKIILQSASETIQKIKRSIKSNRSLINSVNLLIRTQTTKFWSAIFAGWIIFQETTQPFYDCSQFLADRTNGRTYATVLRLTVCCL